MFVVGEAGTRVAPTACAGWRAGGYAIVDASADAIRKARSHPPS